MAASIQARRGGHPLRCKRPWCWSHTLRCKRRWRWGHPLRYKRPWWCDHPLCSKRPWWCDHPCATNALGGVTIPYAANTPGAWKVPWRWDRPPWCPRGAASWMAYALGPISPAPGSNVSCGVANPRPWQQPGGLWHWRRSCTSGTYLLQRPELHTPTAAEVPSSTTGMQSAPASPLLVAPPSPWHDASAKPHWAI